MRARLLSITLRPQLVALIARATDPPPYRLPVGTPPYLPDHARRLTPCSIHAVRDAITVAVPVSYMRAVRVQLVNSLLLSKLLQMILRGLRQRIQAAPACRHLLLLRNLVLRHHVTGAKVGGIAMKTGGEHIESLDRSGERESGARR